MTIELDGFLTFFLVFVRMTAMLVLNPLLSMRSVPTRVTMAFSLLLTVLLTPTVAIVPKMTAFDTALAMLRELFVGFVCGFVFQIFYYLLFYVGDFMDMQFGLSMSKVFNPSSNVQASLSGNMLSIFFVLYFFATDSHLILLRVFASTFLLVPVGQIILSPQSAKLVTEIFIAAFMLALRLLLPFAVAQFTVEVSMGILMKLIPQIHVFVINIQFKILSGLLLLLLFAQPVSSFLDNYTLIMFENIQRAFSSLVG